MGGTGGCVFKSWASETEDVSISNYAEMCKNTMHKNTALYLASDMLLDLWISQSTQLK